MVFAKHLRAVGDEFRSKYLNSTDEADRIPYEEDWTKMKVVSVSLIRGNVKCPCRWVIMDPLLYSRWGWHDCHFWCHLP